MVTEKRLDGDPDIAFKNAYKGLGEVQFEGMYYRRDIGYQVRMF